MAIRDQQPWVNHTPTRPCDSLTLPAPNTLRPDAMWPQNSGIPAPTSTQPTQREQKELTEESEVTPQQSGRSFAAARRAVPDGKSGMRAFLAHPARTWGDVLGRGEALRGGGAVKGHLWEGYRGTLGQL